MKKTGAIPVVTHKPHGRQYFQLLTLRANMSNEISLMNHASIWNIHQATSETKIISSIRIPT